MKRCPKCDASYDADAAWCPVDGTRLEDALHTLTEDTDAGNTMRDLPQSALTPGALTMGWEIPEPPKPSALTMGWEIPEIPDEAPPRTTPTQLAATAVPSTLPGVRLKAATLAPAAPRMTPKSLAAALAKAPAPKRPEPISTPTAINVPMPVEAETIERETIEVAASTLVNTPLQTSALVETEPFEQVEMPRVAPTPTIPPLGPPPNMEPRRAASQSKPPPVRRLITEPMPTAVPPPVVEVLPPQSDRIESPAAIEFTAPVAPVSVELRAPITMPGVVAPAEIRTLRRPPSIAPPMAATPAVPSELNAPSGAALMPPAPHRSNRWMWIAIALIVVGGAVGTLLAMQ